jgi:hypothetical protein
MPDGIEGIEIGPNVIQFEDDFIEIRILGFDSFTGVGDLSVERKQANVGFYYIHLTFRSGNTIRIDYDSANPNHHDYFEFQAAYRNDAIVKVEATKVR